jgi:hypothetical protein
MDEKIIGALIAYTNQDNILWALNPPTGTIYVTSLVVPGTPNSITRTISLNVATNTLGVDNESVIISGPCCSFLLQAINKQAMRIQAASAAQPLQVIADLLGVH